MPVISPLRRRLALTGAWMLLLPGVPAHSGRRDAQAAWSLTDRVHAAAAYLQAQIGHDGQLVYERDARTGQALPAQRYNVLRHAGSLLALAEYHQAHPVDGTTREHTVRAVQRAFDFLVRCCLRPSQPGADDLAVWSDPLLTGGRRRYPVAKLGGAGLSLAAMAQWRRVHPAGVDLATMQALGRFILSQQHSDGRFRSLHALHQGQHDPDWVSLYYPGEAALGLVMLFEHDGNLQWLQAALDALLALARERETLEQPPPDHWALLATARLFRLHPDLLQAALPIGMRWQAVDGSASRGTAGAVAAAVAVAPLLQAHALSVAHTMVREQLADDAPACAWGGFVADSRTAPTATRLEGLLALLGMLDDAHASPVLWPVVERGMGFLRAAQHRGGPAHGAFSRISAACASADTAAHHIRIDHVQHALSALQAYQSLLAGRFATGGTDHHPSARHQTAN